MNRPPQAFTGRSPAWQAAAAFADIGTDELIFCCWTSDPDQIDRIADAVNRPR